jgi:hypothetical protein
LGIRCSGQKRPSCRKAPTFREEQQLAVYCLQYARSRELTAGTSCAAPSSERAVPKTTRPPIPPAPAPPSGSPASQCSRFVREAGPQPRSRRQAREIQLSSSSVSPPRPHGRVPKLLVPFPVGVAGSPAQIGVITGAAAPINSVTYPPPEFVTHTSPEPSIAMPWGSSRLAPTP